MSVSVSVFYIDIPRLSKCETFVMVKVATQVVMVKVATQLKKGDRYWYWFMTWQPDVTHCLCFGLPLTLQAYPQ
jgi:hypothetical protein